MPLPPREGNPFFPLPPDYGDMHADDKAAARVALCQSWYDPKRPRLLISDPEAFYWAFRFFKAHYRKQAPHNRAKYTVKDAPYHDEWIDAISRHRRSLIVAFRDSGKTFVLMEELPEFCLVTRPHTPVQYTTATQPLSEKQIRAIKLDVETNELILHDFGRLQPTRGSSLVWRNDYVEFTNGSSFKAIGADTAMRGSTQMSQRALLQLLDDWEVDKNLKNAELRSDAEDWLTKVYFPMGEPGCWIIWGNTLLAVFALAMHALDGDNPLFDSWYKQRTDIDYFEEVDGVQVRKSAWPARFPVEHLEAMEGSGNAEVVGFGKHAFETEFRNKPGAKGGAALEFDDVRHTFYWDGDAQRKCLHVVETDLRIDYEELKERSIGLVATDLAMGKTWGDYSAISAGRLDDEGVLWVLETWQAKCGPMNALYHALMMAEYWSAEAIAIEVINFEQVAIDQLEEELNRRRDRGEFVCEVCPLNRAGAEAKAIRTLRLQYRFREDKIKIATRGPAKLPFASGCQPLLEQIQLYAYTKGALKHDDALDTLVGLQEGFQRIGRVAYSPKRAKTLIDQMRETRKQGAVYWPGSQNVSVKDAAEIARQTFDNQNRSADPTLNSIGQELAGDLAGTIFDFD